MTEAMDMLILVRKILSAKTKTSTWDVTLESMSLDNRKVGVL